MGMTVGVGRCQPAKLPLSICIPRKRDWSTAHEIEAVVPHHDGLSKSLIPPDRNSRNQIAP